MSCPRSIEQNLRIKNFDARNENYERNAVLKNPGTKQRAQRILGDFWQRESNGQCSKGDNCSFRHEKDKRAKSTQPNPSPNSFTQQNERNASKTRSCRGKSPSGRMSKVWGRVLGQRFHFDLGERFLDCLAEGGTDMTFCS